MGLDIRQQRKGDLEWRFLIGCFHSFPDRHERTGRRSRGTRKTEETQPFIALIPGIRAGCYAIEIGVVGCIVVIVIE